MKLVTFNGLVIENFGSFLGKHELDLSAFDVGVHFVQGLNRVEPRLGANGSGKSTLWNALCWCLDGKTPDGRRNPDIAPRFGDRHTTVVVNLLVDDEKCVIARSTHPNKLTLDGENVTQEEIDTALGMDFNVFTNTVLLGQGQPLFFDLEPKRKMGLFSRVLDLDRWDARSKAASDAVSALENRLAEAVGALKTVETRLASGAALLANARASWASWKKEQETLAAAATARRGELRQRLEEAQALHDKAALAYDGAATELKAAQNISRKKAQELERLVEARTEINAELNTLAAKVAELTAEVRTLGEADTCPLCRQPIKGTDLAARKREVKKTLGDARAHLDRLKENLKAARIREDEVRELLRRSRAAEETFQDKSERERDTADRLTPQIAMLEAEVKQIGQKLKDNERAKNPYTEQVNTLRKQLKSLEDEQKALTERTTKLETQSERTRFWIKGFKEVRLFIVEDVLQELELVTNAALAEVGLVDWTVTYATERETKAGTTQYGLNVFITSPRDKAPVRWECWSGGEKQRLRLIGALALSEVLLARAGVEPNLEILDEPTQHLSDEGIRDLCEFLRFRAQSIGRIIFYTDHNSVDSVQFASSLTVVKDRKGSRLVLSDS